MTEGHVGPEAFDEFVRVTKAGGVIVSTIRESVWQVKGYESKVNGLADEGRVRILGRKRELQRIGAGVYAYFVVLQVQ